MDSKRAIRQFRELKRLGRIMRLAADGWDTEWKILIATIMSAQTKDETTIPVAEELFRKYNSVGKLANAKFSDVLDIIRRVNYNRNKSRNVIACAKVLIEKHNGKVPHEIDKLLELPGVGRKTANVFLAEVGYQAIGVDTHVNSTSNYLGWSKSRNPHKTEEALKKLFPQRYWGELNWVLVRFGKTHTSRKKKHAILDEVKKVK